MRTAMWIDCLAAQTDYLALPFSGVSFTSRSYRSVKNQIGWKIFMGLHLWH